MFPTPRVFRLQQKQEKLSRSEPPHQPPPSFLVFIHRWYSEHDDKSIARWLNARAKPSFLTSRAPHPRSSFRQRPRLTSSSWRKHPSGHGKNDVSSVIAVSREYANNYTADTGILSTTPGTNICSTSLSLQTLFHSDRRIPAKCEEFTF